MTQQPTQPEPNGPDPIPQVPVTALGEQTVRRLQALPNPYVGPRPFTSAERDRFFGREQEANQLIPLIIAERLVLFYATSGAGKSSLINARLVPGLMERNFKVLTGRVGGQLAEGTQADNIFIYNLLLSFERSERGSLPPADSLAHVTLADYLANLDMEAPAETAPAPASPGAEGESARLLVDAPQTIGGLQPLALIIDQFEEIFTTNPGAWNQRAAFFQQISEAFQADPYLWIVFSLREDYLASLDPYAELLPGKLRARFYMQRMGYSAALEAVCRPVEKLRPFEDAATEELVRSLSLINVGKDQNNNPIYRPGQFIEPVQLQVVCYQLWEDLRNRPGKFITTDDLFSLAKGKDLAQFISTALANYYVQSIHEVMSLYPDIRERRLRDWFSHELITETETRSSVRQGRTTTGASPNDLPNPVVRTLQDRFIVRAEIRGDNTWYELSHDRFVGPILQSNREWYDKNARPVEIAAKAWFDTGQDPARLLDGRQLQEALDALRDTPEDISDQAKGFIEASQKAAGSRQKRRQRVVAILASLLILVLSALTLFSLQQSRAATTSAAEANIQRVTANVASTQANLQRSTAEAASELEAQQRSTAEAASAMEAGLRQAAEFARSTAEAAKDQAELARIAAEKDRDAAITAKETAQAASNQAQGARLSSLSDYYRSNKLDLSLLLAVQAVRVSNDDWQAQRALFASIQRGLETRISLAGLAWRTQSRPNSVAFNPDGSLLAVSSTGNVDLWYTIDQRQGPQIPAGFTNDSVVFDVDFDSTGQYLARAGGDGRVRVWNMSTNAIHEYKPFSGLYTSVVSVAFQPGGDLMVAGTDRSPTNGKGLLVFYDYKKEILLGTEDCGNYACHALAWSPDGSMLAVGSQGGTLQVREAKRYQKLMEVNRAHVGEITGLAWYPNGHQLVSGAVDQRLVKWDISERKIVNQTTSQNTPIITSMALSPDGRFLAVGISDKNKWFGLWDAESLTRLDYQIKGHSQVVSSVAFHPRGTQFVTAGFDAVINLWNFEPVDSLSHILMNLNNTRVESMLPGSDGKLNFAGAEGSNDLVTIAEGMEKPVAVKIQHSGFELAAMEGQVWALVGKTDGKVAFLDPQTGKPVRDEIKLSNGSVRSLAASPDGHLLAASICVVGQSCGQIRIWDFRANQLVDTGEELAQITLGDVTSLAFGSETFAASPNKPVYGTGSQVLAIGNAAGSIYLYHLNSKQVTQVVTEGLNLQSTARVVTSLVFSPDQNMLAAGFKDGRIALWEASSGSPIGEFIERANGEVTGLLFRKNPDGLWYLLSVSSQGEVREWMADQQAWIARACQLAGRNLDEAEKAKFMISGGAQADVCPAK